MNVANLSRQVLIHGLVMVLAGLLWGLAVPHTPHPRLALGAHIQLATNGLLFVAMALLLLSLAHRAGVKSLLVMVAAAWLTWGMAGSEVANAWWGTREMLPIAAAQAGVSGAQPLQEAIVKATHALAGLALIAAWSLLLRAFLGRPRD